MIDFNQFTHLTFDCYGTLIDWETGILQAVKPVLAQRAIPATAGQILHAYTQYEAAQEAGPYQSYQAILRGVMAGIASEFGFQPTEAELNALPASVGQWPAFPDTVAALQRLQTRYKLVIISNIDDAMFAEYSQAFRHFQQARSLAQAHQYQENIGVSFYSLANLLRMTGAWTTAHHYFGEALACLTQLGETYFASLVHIYWGYLFHQLDHHQIAIEHCQQAQQQCLSDG